MTQSNALARSGERPHNDGAVKSAPKKKRKSEECRADTERLVWTGLHTFVNSHPELFWKVCDELRLTNAQATLLNAMQPDAPVAMSTLATSLGCHASNVTGLVDRLEEHALVTRQPSAEDRRVKQIALTKKGAEVRENLRAQMFQAPPELARLSAEELDLLHCLVQKLEP